MLFILALGDPAGGSFASAHRLGADATAGFLLALVAALWAYEGLATFCSLAGEVRDPHRNVPRALFIGVGVVMLLYLAVNLAYLYILPLDVIQRSPLVAADASQRVLGTGASALISALVMVLDVRRGRVLSMTEPRVFFAMARDRNFFASIGRIHPRFETPYVAIMAATVIACTYVSDPELRAAGGDIRARPDAVLRPGRARRRELRRTRPDVVRPYRSSAYASVLVALRPAAAIVLGNALIHAPQITPINVGISAAGIPVYFVWKKFYR